MPRIPNLLAFGKHYHNCGKWMQRRALRKDVACNFCNGKIFARNCKLMQVCSRCVECDNIILDNFNICECCGLETNRMLRITKARALSNLFLKNQAAPVSSVKSLAASTIQPDKSQDLFDDIHVDNKELKLIEESLVTDDVSSDKEDNENKLASTSSLLTDVSLEEEEKENILNNGRRTTFSFKVDNKELKLIEESLVTDDVSSDKEDNENKLASTSLLTDVSSRSMLMSRV